MAPWDGNGWTEPVIGSEDQMRMEIPARDADFGYAGDLDAHEPDDYKRPSYIDDLLDRTDNRKD